MFGSHHLFLFAFVGLVCSWTATAGVYVNSDAWNFWLEKPLASLDREGLRKAVEEDVDFYAVPGVKAVLYNSNIQRCFYPTKAGTPFWKDVTVDAEGRMLLRGRFVSSDKTMLTMFHAVTNMMAQLPDYMRCRYDYCHRKGVEMWHSFRVSDVHGTTLGNEWGTHSDLWLDHKDCIRAWYRHAWRGEWPDGTLDYANPLVRKTQLETIRELLMEYPSDGLEFDWLRAVPIFRPGFDAANRGALTQFLRDVRSAADAAERKWGHRIRLSHRVPARVRDAWDLGMDIATWAREGLVDVLMPGGCPATETEQDCDVALYRVLAPKPVVLAAEIDCTVFAAHGWYVGIDDSTYDEAFDAGFASSFYQQGTDTIYFYNHFPRHGARHAWVRGMFTAAADRKTVAARRRRHPATYHYRCGEGRRDESPFPAEIWASCCNGGINVNCGEGNSGREARVVIGATVPLQIDVLVNTVPCGAPRDVIDRKGLPKGRPDATTYYYAVNIPPNVLHDGFNNIELFNRGKETITDRQLVWLEVVVAADSE